MKKRVFGYLTVEATCIMLLTISLYLVIIVLLFLTYDRILLDQNMAMMAVDGRNSLLAKDKDIAQNVEEIAGKYSEDKFIWMQAEPLHYVIQGDRLTIDGKGKIPGVGFDTFGISNKWEAYTNTYELWILNPVTMLRLDKLIEKNNKEKEEGV